MKIYLWDKGFAEPCTGDVVQRNNRVVGITSPIEKDIYKMVFFDGTSVLTTDDMIWTYHYLKHDRHYTVDFKTFRERASMKDLETTFYFFDAMTKPFWFNVDKVLIPPIVAGLYCAQSRALDTMLPPNIFYSSHYFGITKTPTGKKTLLKHMQENWWHDTHFRPLNAYIPDEIKYSTVHKRCEFLTGFFSLKGKTDSRKTKILVSVTSRQLADDLIWLIRSLGGQAGYKKFRLPRTFNIFIYPNDVIFPSLPSRMQVNLVNCTDDSIKYKKLRGIEYMGKMPWSDIHTELGVYYNEDFIPVRGEKFGESKES